MGSRLGASDVLIVGAGITGCAAARALAPEHDVLVLDRGQIAGETTGRASGLISIVHDYPDHATAAKYATDFFDAYDGTGAFTFARRPCLFLVEPERVESAREAAEGKAREGFDVAYLDAAGLEERYPDTFVTAPFAGAVEYRQGGWVDPHTLAMTYRDDAAATGARFETGVTVERLRVRDEVVEGVETNAGGVDASSVVVAAGWQTRNLLAELVDLPIRPFRYQTVNPAVDRDLGADFPIGWERLTRLYWRPEHNGELHVGGGTYFVEPRAQPRTRTTEEFRALVAATISERLWGLGDPRIVSEDTCSTGDAATPDGYPIIDPPREAPAGLVVATGMHGFGIMASPIVGAAVRALVTHEDSPFPLTGFALDRFDDRSPAFGSPYIAEPDEPLIDS